jgi:SanA protein
MKAKKFIRWLLLVCFFLAGIVVFCNVSIDSYARHRVCDRIEDVPRRHAAVVLGTSPTGRNGGPNRFFHARIDACADLYDAGKIDRVIVSGDNRYVTYNEPAAMKSALVAKGVPADVIFLDYAGFRTLDSVVRAKEVFGQSSFIVVSQRFHNERAVFIAGKKGIDAVGYNAGDVGFHYGFVTYVREWFARCKVYLDLLVGKKPHFLGEPVDIG